MPCLKGERLLTWRSSWSLWPLEGPGDRGRPSCAAFPYAGVSMATKRKPLQHISINTDYFSL